MFACFRINISFTIRDSSWNTLSSIIIDNSLITTLLTQFWCSIFATYIIGQTIANVSNALEFIRGQMKSTCATGTSIIINLSSGTIINIQRLYSYHTNICVQIVVISAFQTNIICCLRESFTIGRFLSMGFTFCFVVI